MTGEILDLPSAEFDAVLSTWTLCTIPNMDAALAEIRRVLKPAARCTSWSMATPPTRRSRAYNGASNR